MENIKVIDDWLETAQLICTKTDGKTKYEFNKFTSPLKFATKIYRYDLTLQDVRDDQKKFKILMNKLNNNYTPTNLTKIKEKDDTLRSAKKLFSIRKEIINAFKKGIFPYMGGFQVEKETDEEMDTTIMSELESEDSAAERRNQEGNNSEKLKNEIRQLLYSLYRSRKNLQNKSIKV